MKEARLCNRFGSSLFSTRLRYVSPLSRSLRAVVGKTGKWRGTIKSPTTFYRHRLQKPCNFMKLLAHPEGLEPPTPRFVVFEQLNDFNALFRN